MGMRNSAMVWNPVDMGPRNSEHFSSSLDFKPLFNHDAQILFQTMIKPQYMGFKPKRSPSVSNFKAWLTLCHDHLFQHEVVNCVKSLGNGSEESWFTNGGHSPKGALMLKFWINVQIYTNFYTDILPNFLFSISSVLLAADNWRLGLFKHHLFYFT